MNNFNFKRRSLFLGPHFLGTLLIIAGLFALVSPTFLKSESPLERVLMVGIGAIAIGLFIVSTYSGTFIDFPQKRFKDYLSVGTYKFGEWMILPEISKIKVISTRYISHNTPNEISPTISGTVTDFMILVYSTSSKPIFSFKYSNRESAVKHAKSLNSHLNVDLVLNMPEREPNQRLV